MIPNIRKIRERINLRNDLKHIISTPEGKRFFDTFLRHCNVTNPVFYKDPNEATAAEARRRLAMSYLSLIADTNTDKLVSILEEEQNHNRKE